MAPAGAVLPQPAEGDNRDERRRAVSRGGVAGRLDAKRERLVMTEFAFTLAP